MNATSGVLTTLVEFTGSGASNKGAIPSNGLVSDGSGFFWGTTYQGGAANIGTVFKVNATNGMLTTLMEFTGSGSQGNSGSYPEYGSLLKHTDGNFYGTTIGGGPGGGGTIFRLRFGPTPTSLAATAVTSTSATLLGTVNPNGLATTAAFEWGTDATLTTSTLASAGTTTAGTSPASVSAPLAGLAPGTVYYYRAQGVNADNAIPQRGEILSFQTLTVFQDWKLTHLGDANAPDLGNPDGDGLATLAEYGIATLPQTPDAAPHPASRFTYPEGERLRLFLQRDSSHNEVTVAVESADSLAGPWAPLATSTLGAPFAGPGYVSGDDAAPGVKTVEIRDTVNITDAPGRFMRVRVVRP